MSKTIALITARGGSKRIPRKNIKHFLGKPIISYVIETAIASNLFDEVLVSTDDLEIGRIAELFGAKVPFFRSEGTSNDYATTVDVIEEFVGNYKTHFSTTNVSTICCIYPTAPLITVELLKHSYQKFIEGKYDSLFPVQRFNYPIQRALFLSNGKLQWMNPENSLKRSQDLEPTFHDVGQFYYLSVESFLKNKSLITGNTSYVEISEFQAQDIDTLDDWKMAEMKYRFINEKI